MNSAQSRVCMAGHRRLASGAISRRLARDAFKNLIANSSSELNLRSQAAVDTFYEARAPRICIHGGEEGGRHSCHSSYLADLVHDNLHGTSRNLREASRLRALGWQPRIPPRQSTEAAYERFVSDQDKVRG